MTALTSKLSIDQIREEGIDLSYHIIILAGMETLPDKKGITSQIANACKMLDHKVSKRLMEMKRRGLIEETGEMIRSAETGRLQTEWAIRVKSDDDK